ncbi:MAG TPA: serine hydrolase [Chitinophagaceae bacterium]|nr:serine hydrolase [Chitinophagaceae bacterium]
MRSLLTIVISISFNLCSAQYATPASYKKPQQLNDGLTTASLKDAGLNEMILRAMTDSIINRNYTNIHSVLIFRNNKLVYENYFPGNDEVRTRGKVGFVDHHRDSLHDVRSITKSVTGAAVMIALHQGKIKSLNQRVFDLFPEHKKYATGMKQDITIRHLLNMSSGLYWIEAGSFMDSMKLAAAPAAVEFVLKQRLVDTPGTKFNYSDGSTQVLADIVEKVTGMDIIAFTKQYLFQPLGITNYEWTKQKSGMISAWAGLRMRSRDLLKFGILHLNEGKWNGKQIIPSYLVKQTLKSQVSTLSGDPLLQLGYSNQFWIYSEYIQGHPAMYAQAQGNGGQIIVIDRKSNIVVVLTAGNYDVTELRKSSWNIYYDFVFPAVIRKKN